MGAVPIPNRDKGVLPRKRKRPHRQTVHGPLRIRHAHKFDRAKALTSTNVAVFEPEQPATAKSVTKAAIRNACKRPVVIYFHFIFLVSLTDDYGMI